MLPQRLQWASYLFQQAAQATTWSAGMVLICVSGLFCLRPVTVLFADDAARLSQAQQVEFFETRIRPVLVEHCYSCHNSSETAEGGLALDHREAFRKGGNGGIVLTPGNPKASPLLAILRHEVEGLEMPSGGPQLDQAVIADFQRWIAAGAQDPRDQPPDADALASSQAWESLLQRRKTWWSFQPIVDPVPPTVGSQSEGDVPNRHPVDQFLYATLAATDLRPSPPADASTLVRRLYFALIGLPPTISQSTLWTARIANAGANRRDAAIADLVEELLASPQFGHRWARHWMDWIRYAESHGSEGDPAIENAWMYRDYLIRALNNDVPIDQLIREHVAGDLLQDPRRNPTDLFNESVIGTTHWRMVFHGFAPTDALEERVRFTDDQINTFGKAFLGLTVSCARCHDHKFDAISQADYYALYGILNACRPGRAAIELPEHQDRHRDELTDIKAQLKALAATTWTSTLDALPQRMAQRIGTDPETLPDDSLGAMYWQFSQAFEADAKSVVSLWHDLRRAPSGSVAPSPTNSSPPSGRESFEDLSTWFPYGNGLSDGITAPGQFVVSQAGDAVIAEIYPAGIYSHLISSKHAARLTSPDIQLDDDYEVWVNVLGDGGASLRYVVQDYPRRGTVYPVISLTPQWQWQRFDLRYWNGDQIHMELAAALDAPLLVGRQARSWFGVRGVRLIRPGQPRPAKQDESLAVLWDSLSEPPASLQDLDAAVVQSLREAIQAWRADRLDDGQALFLNRCLQEGWLVNQVDQLRGAQPLVDRYRKLESQIPVPRRVPSLEEAPRPDQALMVRGDHRQLGELIPRRFLEAIDPTPYPMVPTTGTAPASAHQGQPSSASGRLRLAEDLLRDDNPLTRRVLVNRIWHHLFGRGIVATPDNFGRMGAPPTHPELLDWLACRLPEADWSLKHMIRTLVTSRTWQASSTPTPEAVAIDPDNRLWSHGRLKRLEAEAIRDSMLSVAQTIDLTSFGPPVDGQVPRRSIYVAVRRNALDSFLRVFDFPEPFAATGRRDATNVPAQSLTLMNAPQVVAAAHSWSQAVLADDSLIDDRQRIEAMFQAALGRRAATDELAQAIQFLEDARRLYAGLRNERQRISRQIQIANESIAQILNPVRIELQARKAIRVRSAATLAADSDTQVPEPIRDWDFTTGRKDLIAGDALELRGDAVLMDDALVVRGNGYAVTRPFDFSLRAKTLQAWVQLDNTTQRGGGVLTIQTPAGTVFDAIVFGEQTPGQWLAGSNHFARTQPLGGERETEASDAPVQITIVYQADGRIAAYRNGLPYGNSYQSRGVQPFLDGHTVLCVGVRHLPEGGNRMLSGRIHRARLYDVALTPEQVQTSFETTTPVVSDAELLGHLTVDQRHDVARLRSQVANLTSRARELETTLQGDDTRAVWADLAHSLFTLPEFIYVR